MELTQFNFEMERLRDRYGKNKYPQVLADLLYSKFRKIEYASFKRTVSKLIACEMYAPLFPKFQDELLSELVRIKEQEHEELTKNHNCSSCNNTGRVYEYLNEGEAAYSFKCHCKLGEMLFPNFPRRQNVCRQ